MAGVSYKLGTPQNGRLASDSDMKLSQVVVVPGETSTAMKCGASDVKYVMVAALQGCCPLGYEITVP